jgi:hypothetical protein
VPFSPGFSTDGTARQLFVHSVDDEGFVCDLVLLFGITVTYLTEQRQAAEASRLLSIFSKRAAKSLRVKVH